MQGAAPDLAHCVYHPQPRAEFPRPPLISDTASPILTLADACQSVASRCGCLAWSLLLWASLAYPILAAAVAGFTIDGHPVTPQESNFAGVRHASPMYRIPVQINHDTQPTGNLELTVVDDVFQALLTHHRQAPYVSVDALPVVVIADLKLRRFSAGPRRLLFGQLETEIKQQRDVYAAPTAIFITDAALGDAERLRADLWLGLGFLFNEEFSRALVGLERAVPRPAE
jgi:hypothetical protein